MKCKTIQYHDGTVTIMQDDHEIDNDGIILRVKKSGRTVFEVLSMAVKRIISPSESHAQAHIQEETR